MRFTLLEDISAEEGDTIDVDYDGFDEVYRVKINGVEIRTEEES